jgi:hypothetical protein
MASAQYDACLLRTLVPTGPDAIILRLPLLQSLHRRPGNSATGATHVQEEREETNACDEPCNALIQLLTPYYWFPLLVSACLSAYPWIRLLTRSEEQVGVLSLPIAESPPSFAFSANTLTICGNGRQPVRTAARLRHPTRRHRLNQQRAGVHATPQDVNGVAFVG